MAEEMSLTECCSFPASDIEPGLGYKIEGSKCYINIDTKKDNELELDSSIKSNIIEQGMNVFRSGDIAGNVVAAKLNDDVMYHLDKKFKAFKEGKNSNECHIDDRLVESIKNCGRLYPIMVVFTGDDDQAMLCYELIQERQ